MELLAAHQILHVAEPNIPKSVTLRDGQYDGIVWQPHLGVDAAVQGVDQHQRRTAEVSLAQLLRDQPEAKTAAIGLLQVAQHDLFSEPIQVNRLIAAGAEADHLAGLRRAGQRRNGGAHLRGNGTEDGKPIL